MPADSIRPSQSEIHNSMKRDENTLLQVLMSHPYRNRVLSESFSCLTTIIILSWSVLASAETGGEETDRLALLEFKARMADPDGVLSSWNDTSHFCEWYGVTGGRRHRRVTVLDLSSKRLSGVLPPHIGNMSFLREIYLQNNSFFSGIPSHFGRLSRLQNLSLDNNSFSGQIPSNLSHCSNLLFLNLGFNKLDGNLPTELSSLSKLQGLVLQVNNLTGDIPPSFGNLSSLRVFATSLNSLSGRIPETLGHLRNLNTLTLAWNKFVGTIPISIFNTSTLTVFDTAGNQLEGGLPSDSGFALPNLKIFSLSFNQLSGPIPESMSNASNLGLIQISNNNFFGKVPSFSKMRGLHHLTIGTNNFGSGQSGDLDFLCSLTNSINLNVLGMRSNAFGGSIPNCIGNLSITLSRLRLDDNFVSGTLPSEIGNLINLEELPLQGNMLEGNGGARRRLHVAVANDVDSCGREMSGSGCHGDEIEKGVADCSKHGETSTRERRFWGWRKEEREWGKRKQKLG